MSTFVLVHGAWHGAWAWYKIVSRLEAAGHDVHAPDLPAHGTDTTPIEEVSMESHVERICESVQSSAEPVVLVGHSMAGMIITQVAERYPDEIGELVYLSAFLPEDGMALIDYAKPDEESVVTQNLVIDEDAGIATVAEDALEEAFYADCSDADVTLAKSLLRPEPLAGFLAPAETSAGGFESVPRTYIGCEQDRAITPSNQQTMYEARPCKEVRYLDASHSPFLSVPEELTAALHDIA